MLNYRCEFCSSLHCAFSVLNANVRTLSSHVESLKRHNSYFTAQRCMCTWFFTRTGETLHRINSIVFTSLLLPMIHCLIIIIIIIRWLFRTVFRSTEYSAESMGSSHKIPLPSLVFSIINILHYVVYLLLSPSLFCLPINWETICWCKEQQLYSESQQTKRGWTHVPKNHLAWVRISASFKLKGEEVKSNISWF